MYKTFNCENCKTTLRIDAEKKFPRGRCPKCGKWIKIPAKSSDPKPKKDK